MQGRKISSSLPLASSSHFSSRDRLRSKRRWPANAMPHVRQTTVTVARTPQPPLIENEQADRRRQVALLALSVNFKGKFFDRSISMSSDFLERGPKRVFQGDTSLAAVDLHRSLNNRRFRDQSLTTAKLHSITSSARVTSVEGSSRPIALAALRLTTRARRAGAPPC
jgi:hypothetical protein